MDMKPYYIGVETALDAVGFAVTDNEYKLLKHNGEPIWGTTIFGEADSAAERRSFRLNRRRLDRRQLRIQLVQELFAKEISKKDPTFFQRIQQSKLTRSEAGSDHIFFQDADYTDKDYYKQYPTIHHLILELMQDKTPHDARLVCLACSWLVAHRGHFLSKVDKNHIEDILDITQIYQDLMQHFRHLTEDGNHLMPWQDCDMQKFAEIVKEDLGPRAKSEAFYTLLFDGKKPKAKEDLACGYPYSREAVIRLLSGGTVKVRALFPLGEFQNLTRESISLGMTDEDFEVLYAEIGENAALVQKLKAIYDWGQLVDILGDAECISQAKVRVYDQHKKDKAQLKAYVRKYIPGKYDTIFNVAAADNYVAYSYALKNAKDPTAKTVINRKASQESFCAFLKSLLKDVVPEPADSADFYEMYGRIEANRFMPKQVSQDNKVIPYQLYYDELKQVLTNASAYLPFLREKDQDGMTGKEKILSIMVFRVPYFVGPLRKDNCTTAWIERKADGPIRPWNFEKKVDLDASEQAFIDKMVNKCIYYPGAKVVPHDSLLYSAFTALDELNTMTIGTRKLPVRIKQELFTGLYCKRKRVTSAQIRAFLLKQNLLPQAEVELLNNVKTNSAAKTTAYVAFGPYLESHKLTEAEAEQIILRISCTTDTHRLKLWLKNNFPKLTEEERSSIAHMQYSDFGRLSKEFLCQLHGVDNSTGAYLTVMEALWTTQCNLDEILTDRFTFAEELAKIRKDYYADNPITLNQRLDELWVVTAAKRPVIRTFRVVDEIVKSQKHAPSKIFLKMVTEQEPLKSVSRKSHLEKCYRDQEGKDKRVQRMQAELDSLGSNAEALLKKDKVYLYFLQLGKCLYTGVDITLNEILADSDDYTVDHIYPRRYVKDESVLNNKVLVCKDVNKEKDDKYPISRKIQEQMAPYWKELFDRNLIGTEKNSRLLRTTPFTEDECWEFIDRMQTESKMSNQAIVTILQERYPDTRIITVRKSQVSEFRNTFNFPRPTVVNAFYHAKDAYLNVVVGNVYDEKFNRKWFSVSQSYSVKLETTFTHDVEHDGYKAWDTKTSMDQVRKVMYKNSGHLTKFVSLKRGQLFDQLPLKAGPGLVPLKKDLPTEIYGGYNKPGAAGFALVQFKAGQKVDAVFVPIEIQYLKRYRQDEAFAISHVSEFLESVWKVRNLDWVKFPLGYRLLPVSTILNFDGFRGGIRGKSGGGKRLGILPMTPLFLSKEMMDYTKSLESFEKRASVEDYEYDPQRERVNPEDNLRLYDTICWKLQEKPFSIRPNNPVQHLLAGRAHFMDLDVSKQATALVRIFDIFSQKLAPCDLTLIGGAKSSGSVQINALVSGLTKHFQDIRIVSTSVTGMYEQVSDNILDLVDTKERKALVV